MKTFRMAINKRSHFFVYSLIITVLFILISTNAETNGLPDLVVSQTDAGGVITDGQTLNVGGTLVARVQNAGNADVLTSFILTAFEDADGNGGFDPSTDIVLGTSTHAAALPAGASHDVPVALSGTVSFKGNIIYVFVDSGNVISESNENNNLRHSGQESQFVPPVGAFAPALEWSWASSAVDPSSLNVMMTPAVIDLTGDKIPEVVFASTSSTGGGLVEVGILRALNGANGSELFSVTDATLRVSTTASVAVGDIDQDGLPEIIACDSSGSRLIAFENNGTFKWRSATLEAINWGAPALADLNADGKPEIIMGRQVLDNNGIVLWTGTGGRGSQGSVGAISIVADINLDGTPEIIAGNTAYNAAGGILWSAPLTDGHNAIGNFDSDNLPEVVLVSNGSVWLLENNGSVKWGPVSIPGGGAGGPPTVADYDSDGEAEIGVAGATRYAVLETSGSLKWAAVTQDSSSNRTGSSVFDFDGNGSAEVVYRDELKLRVYRGSDGVVLFETPMSSCTWHEYVLVADVDADGNAEIVAVANNNCGFGPQRGVYVFGDANDNWVSTRKIWNQHSYHITNVNADGTIPPVESNNWLVPGLNNYRLNELLPGEGRSFDAPDLIPSYIRADTDNCQASATIIARVGNGGALLAPVGIKVSFYDGDPLSGGTLLGTAATSGPMDPGEFEDVQMIWNNPPIGNREIFVVADDNGAGVGTVNEGNEFNNSYSATVALCSCVTDLTARPKSGKVQLTWTHVGAHHYNVYRGTVAGGPYLKIAGTASAYSLYLDQSVVNGTTYYYVVRTAASTGIETCQSNEASARPGGRP